MSDARKAILSALEAAQPPSSPVPQRVATPRMPRQPLETLRERIEESGGHLQSLARHERLAGVDWPVDLATAHHVYSAHPALESRGVGVAAEGDRELALLELCVLVGEFTVVENGAVWHTPDSRRERLAALLAEHLVIIAPASAIVPTLHEAYDRIDLSASSFGWFLCGPSKTADIEQALVLGAHGPRTMALVLETD
ncbi:MAG: hypothetical protein CL908_07330 [Deltaproteobacteria bacterium]|nr:hypothetical protein [Deltaproteobacteria bacterium]